MGRKSLVLIFLFLFSFVFVSAESIPQRQDGNVDEPYIISQPCASCSYINISVFNEGGKVLDNVAMTNNGTEWTYTFTPTNRTRHDVNGIGDINGNDDSFAFYFEVDPINVSATIFMLILFSAAIIGLAVIHKRVNFEAWHDKILNNDKTFVRSALASIPYTFMKDIFLVYYLLGFPIIFLVTDLITFYNLSSISYLFQIFSQIYTVGLVLPGIILLGHMIGVIRNLSEEFTNKNWGIS